MSQLKKVIPSLALKKGENKNLAQIRKSCERNNALKRGYEEMASLNLTLARVCFEADCDALSVCEEKLTECE